MEMVVAIMWKGEKVKWWKGSPKHTLPDHKAVSSRPVGVPAKARSGLVGWLEPGSSLLEVIVGKPVPWSSHTGCPGWRDRQARCVPPHDCARIWSEADISIDKPRLKLDLGSYLRPWSSSEKS